MSKTNNVNTNNAKLNNMVKERLGRDNVVAVKKDLISQYIDNHRTVFYQQLQTYITKIGITLAEVMYPNVHVSTFLQSIDFLCLRVIKDKQMHAILKALGVNSSGNKVKHTIIDLEKGDLDTTIKIYNNFIGKIIKATGLNAFSDCYVNKKSKKEDSLFYEESYHKYFTVGGIKMEIKLSPNFEVDIYNKQVKSKATLYLPKGKKDYSVELEIFQKNNNHRLAKISKTSIEEDDKKLVAPLTISEKHLSDRKLETKIVVVLYKKEEYSYTTGALFWTKVHTANVDKEVERKELEMWVNYFNSNRK